MPAVLRGAGRDEPVLVSRDLNFGDNERLVDILLAFLGLAFLALLCVGALLFMKKRALRQRQLMNEKSLPKYDEIEHGDVRNHRRLTISTPEGNSNIVVVKGRPMLADPSSPPYSPNNVPEIHITFPDEQDEQGRQRNGRVMLVRVGDATVGLEPIRDEQLPAYERENSHGFYSIDMNQIGGLKEKDRVQFK
jgi:hypothetical protein